MNPTARPASYDSLALEILMSKVSKKTKDARLQALYVKAGNYSGPCPECGSKGPHQNNGSDRFSELAFCCKNCGNHWDAL